MELIKEPNKALKKELFLNCLYKHAEPIELEIIKVSDVFKSKLNNQPNISVDIEILEDIKTLSYKVNGAGEFIYTETGEKEIAIINGKNNIVSLFYPLVKTREENKYIVSSRSNLFPLLNYAFKKNGLVQPDNTQGFNNVTLQEMKEALTNLKFEGMSQLVTNTNFTPYYKLTPI